MILVTGASGFLGLHLLQELAKGEIPVRALYHTHTPQWKHPLVQWMSCDLLDVMDVSIAMQDIQEVYHCAGIVSFDKKNKQRVITENVAATANLVNEALTCKVRKLIHVSSIAALGREEENDTRIAETNQWQENSQNTAYAAGKYYSEMEVWRAMAEGLNAAIVNPGIILGIGDWNKGSAKLMQNVAKEFPWYTEGVNAWVSATDLAKAMIILMKSDQSAERYILAEGNHSYKEVFTLMAKYLNKKAPHKKASPWMTDLIWRLSSLKSILSGKPSLITKETARTAQSLCYYDNSKWQMAFPSFTFTPLEETIKEMAAAYHK